MLKTAARTVKIAHCNKYSGRLKKTCDRITQLLFLLHFSRGTGMHLLELYLNLRIHLALMSGKIKCALVLYRLQRAELKIYTREVLQIILLNRFEANERNQRTEVRKCYFMNRTI